VHGGLHAAVRLVSAAFLIRDQQLAVRGEFLFRRLAEALLRPPQPALHTAQFGQREVDGVLHGAARVEVEGLGEVAGAAGEADGDLPGVRHLGRGQQPQQGGLAGAVLADDGGLLAGADGETNLVEDGSGAIGLGHVLDGQLRHDSGHSSMGAFAHVTFPENVKCLRAAETAASAVPGLRESRRKPCPHHTRRFVSSLLVCVCVTKP
jgi:hypothetical protein